MPFRCKACYDFSSSDLQDVYKHALDCPDGVNCPLCAKGLWSGEDLRDHMKDKHSKFKCAVCEKRFFLRKSLEDHEEYTGHSACANRINSGSVKILPLTTFIESEVRPSDEEVEGLGRTVGELVLFLHKFNDFVWEKDYRISKVIKSGSLGKGTAVRDRMDVDLVAIMPGFGDMDTFLSNLPRILKDLARYANTHGSLTDVTRNKYQVKCNLDGFSVDISPAADLFPNGSDDRHAVYEEMGEQSGSSYSGPQSHYSVCLAELQRDFVNDFTDDEPGLKDLIRLVKYWSKGQDLPIASYCLEMVCIKAYQEFGGSTNFSIERLFKRVMEKLADMKNLRVNFNYYYQGRNYSEYWSVPYVMDPANPYNNTLPPGYGDRRAVASAASSTLQGRASNGSFNCCVSF